MRRWGLVGLVVLAQAAVAQAHWRTQELGLQPGWNAVFLEVEPEPRDPAGALAGLPVDALWAWNPSTTTVQYIQDPATLLPGQPEWLSFIPGRAPEVSNLFTLRGGRAYLVHVSGTAPVTWRVTGEPVVPRARWLPNSYNLVGFPVDPANPATLGTFFAASPAHAPLTVYRLNRGATPARWEKLAAPATTPITPGEAYWVWAGAYSEYAGALTVTGTDGGRLEFGRALEERTLRLRNGSGSASQLTLALGAAAPPPAGEAALSGAVLLSYWNGNVVPGQWVDLAGGATFTVPARSDLELRLAVRRAAMPGSVYGSLLEVRGTSGGAVGQRVVVPVRARGRGSAVAGSRTGAASGAPAGTNPRAGLWVGTAAVTHVSHPTGGEVTPTKAASEFGLRLLVHVDADGTARLLDHVTLMWQDGTTAPDPTTGKLVVATPGRYVLVTNDALLDQFKGAAVRDGQQIGRRFSTAAFAVPAPVALTGSFDGTLRGTLTLAYDDPVNPFLHRYHPDHDNLDARFEQPLPEGVESYTITRDVTLAFQAADPEGLQLAGAGDTRVGGTYAETLQGLHREALHVQGTFRLTRVSAVGVLNDGL